MKQHAKKRKTHGKSKSKTSKLKKNGSKINGEKGTSKREKNMGKTWTCPFESFFAFSICIFFAFILHFFLLFENKSNNKCKIKANKEHIEKNKITAKKMQMDRTSPFFQFSPFLTFLFFPLFFPFYFAFVFFGLC